MAMRYAIGIDVGGTVLKAVACRDDGQELSRETMPVATTGGRVAEAASRLFEALASPQEQGPAAVGIASPGLPAPDGRSASCLVGRKTDTEELDWTNYFGWHETIPVLNDAQAALLGERWRGAARESPNAVMLTLGTGVGGAFLTDGRLWRGTIGRAGHLGHLCLDVDGPPGIFRTPGALENAIGEQTLASRSGGRFHATRELVEAAQTGDEEATAVWRRSVYTLACGIASIINVLDPDRVILGGGIAQAGAALFEPLEEELDRVEWRPHGHRVPIVAAELGEVGGAIGAAYHALNPIAVKARKVAEPR